MKKGFTLIETLLSLAISAMILLGCFALMNNMYNIVSTLEEGDPLDDHANGVENFLTGCIRNAKFPDKMENSLVGSKNNSITGGVRLGVNPESTSLETPQICFGVPKDVPFFISRKNFSPEKICWMELFDDGLYLMWTFIQPESKDRDRNIYKSLISPYVSDVSYIYLRSDGSFKEETEITIDENGAYTLPMLFKLHFKRGSEEQYRNIELYNYEN